MPFYIFPKKSSGGSGGGVSTDYLSATTSAPISTGPGTDLIVFDTPGGSSGTSISWNSDTSEFDLASGLYVVSGFMDVTSGTTPNHLNVRCITTNCDYGTTYASVAVPDAGGLVTGQFTAVIKAQASGASFNVQWSTGDSIASNFTILDAHVLIQKLS